MLTEEALLQYDLVVGEVFLVRNYAKACEGTLRGRPSKIVVGPPDALVIGERSSVLEHLGPLGERTHDSVQIVIVLCRQVSPDQRSSPFAFCVVE